MSNLLDDGQNTTEEPFFRPDNMLIALIVLEVIAYITIFSDAYSGTHQVAYSPISIVLLLCLGVVYHLLVVKEEELHRYLPKTAIPWFYFGSHLILLATIGMLSQAQGQWWLLIMPVAGSTVIYRGWWMISVSIVNILTVMGVGSFYWPDLTLSDLLNVPLYIAPAIVFVIIFSYSAHRERESRQHIEELANELHHANIKLSEYAGKVEELAILQERNRMAREIHDSLGHYLTVVNVQIGAAKAILPLNIDKAQNALDKAQKLTQEGLSEVRQSVAVLREGREERPLSETLPELIELTQTAGIETTLAVIGKVRPLSNKVTRVTYRTIQEALTNIRRHAEASEASVTINYDHQESLGLVITDNGRGAEQTDGGFGLLGMRERIQLLGGQVKIETAPNDGFQLIIHIPTQEEKNE